jgi:hypothetical protein
VSVSDCVSTGCERRSATFSLRAQGHVRERIRDYDETRAGGDSQLPSLEVVSVPFPWALDVARQHENAAGLPSTLRGLSFVVGDHNTLHLAEPLDADMATMRFKRFLQET